MIQRYDFAPLDGITRSVFRRVWFRHFGGADRCFIPFFSPTHHHLMTPKDLRELDRANNPDMVLIPQIMTRRAEDLIWAVEQVRDLGYQEANLNLGCPSGTVTAKGKGAGFLAEPDGLDRFFDAAFPKLSLPLSVKTRIGLRSPEEFPRLLEVFNRYPLASLIIHPRVAKEKYSGPIHEEAFALALRESRNPVCYNGDLRTVGEAEAFSRRFPDAEAVMIGRGGVADPALFRKLRGGTATGCTSAANHASAASHTNAGTAASRAASREDLQAFTTDLYREYQIFYGQIGSAAQRMREIWFYLIHLFDYEADKRLNKQMRRFRIPGEYEAAETAIFQELPLRQDSQGDLI